MTQLGLHKLIFMLELLVAEYMFLCHLKRRKHYWLRLSLSYLACMVIAFVFPIFAYNAVYASVMFLILFGISVLFLKLCYDETWINIFYCAFAAYTAQQVAYDFGEISMEVSGLTEVLSDLSGGTFGSGVLSTYGNSTVQIVNIYEYLVNFVCLIFTYWVFYLLFATKIKSGEELKIKKIGWFILALSLVLVQIVFNAIIVYYSYDNFDKMYYVICMLYNVICCIVALVLQFNVMQSERLESEVEIFSYMMAEKEKQYAMSKEMVDLINEKCHDLKHTVRLWKRGGGSDEEINELQQAIALYDSAVHTGNEAFDTILSEKSFNCTQNGITLSCLADSSLVAFMREVDAYALFGNLLENAIEAVSKLPDKEKKVISLNVKKVNDMTVVTCKNYYEGDLQFENDLPKTGKEDKLRHGFGMKSMRRIVENYGGDFSAKAEGGIFAVTMTFYGVQHSPV